MKNSCNIEVFFIFSMRTPLFSINELVFFFFQFFIRKRKENLKKEKLFSERIFNILDG
jgi:hypothetical protein